MDLEPFSCSCCITSHHLSLNPCFKSDVEAFRYLEVLPFEGEVRAIAINLDIEDGFDMLGH